MVSKHIGHVCDVDHIPVLETGCVIICASEHISHRFDVGDIPVGNGLVKSGLRKHEVHIGDVGDVPVSERLIIRRTSEHVAHIFDFGNVPAGEWLVKRSGSPEHTPHVSDVGNIIFPCTEILVKSFGIAEEVCQRLWFDKFQFSDGLIKLCCPVEDVVHV